MHPDAAAEKLQLSERGIELLKRCDENPTILKAIQQVQGGFEPRDVAALYGLPYEVEEEEHVEEGDIQVWECRTPRCRQKGRVSTATSEDPQICPSCRREMHFLMSVADAEEISHMRRTYLPRGNIDDPLYRTDRTRDGAPPSELGEDE